MTLPQLHELSLDVPKLEGKAVRSFFSSRLLRPDHRPTQTNAPLPFSAILSSFPQLESLTLTNIFSLSDAKFLADLVDTTPTLLDTPLEQLFSFIGAETSIEKVACARITALYGSDMTRVQCEASITSLCTPSCEVSWSPFSILLRAEVYDLSTSPGKSGIASLRMRR